MMAPSRRLLAGSVLVILLVAIAVAMVGEPVTQPIDFNHRMHVEDVGLECTDCHLYALTGMRATIPNLEVCGDCHEEAQSDSPEEARLVGIIQSGERIPWWKVHRVPDHVFFSHRRHTAVAQIECETCHGEVAELEMPLTRPLVRMTMDRCIECHRESEASNDCLLCHK